MPNAENAQAMLPRLQPPKLLDQMRQVLRTKHCSYRTEQAYVDWPKLHRFHCPEQLLGRLETDGGVHHFGQFRLWLSRVGWTTRCSERSGQTEGGEKDLRSCATKSTTA